MARVAISSALLGLFAVTSSATPLSAAAASGRAPAAASIPRQAVDCRQLKCVALTFDDGPAGSTDQLLTTLRRKEAKVTFFALGQQVAAYPKVAQRAVSEGHEMGVHTWDHKSLATLSPEARRLQIDRTVAVIKRTTGVRPTLMRPPYGATNDAIRAQERRAGLAEVLWSIDTLDWKNRDSDIVTRRVLAQTRRGSIVLMHDIHKTTVDAAPRIIDGLRKRGFTLVTVSQLLGNPRPGVKYTHG